MDEKDYRENMRVLRGFWRKGIYVGKSEGPGSSLMSFFVENRVFFEGPKENCRVDLILREVEWRVFNAKSEVLTVLADHYVLRGDWAGSLHLEKRMNKL